MSQGEDELSVENSGQDDCRLLKNRGFSLSVHFYIILPATLHMALTLMAVWFLVNETHRGQQWTPALTLPQVRYGLSVLLMETFLTLGVSSICRHVQRQLLRNELARFYHHRTRKCLPPRKLRRNIQ
jgi:hypothetical protein